MNRFFWIIAWLLTFFMSANAQKPIISTKDYSNWGVIERPYLTENGKYIKFDSVVGNNRYTKVRSIRGNWSREFLNTDVRLLSNDTYIFQYDNDRLNIYKIGDSKEYHLLVKWHQLIDNEKGPILLYQIENSEDLSLFYFDKSVFEKINNVGLIYECYQKESTKVIILKCKKSDVLSIHILNLLHKKDFLVADSLRDAQFIIARNQNKVTFLYRDLKDSVYLCTLLLNNIKRQCVNCSSPLNAKFEMLYGYSDMEDSVIISIREKIRNDFTEDIRLPKITLWSINNVNLKSSLEKSVPEDKFFKVSLKNGQLLELKENPFNARKRDVLDSLIGFGGVVSPKSNFIVFMKDQNYYSYNIKTRNLRKLTDLPNLNLDFSENGDYDVFRVKSKIIAWSDKEEDVFIKDEYDIWQFSLKGAYPPRNLTNGIGRKRKISFDIVDGNHNSDLIIYPSKPCVLVAFDTETKKNGFYYKKSLNSTLDPVEVLMEDATYWLRNPPLSYYRLISSSDFPPQKAKKENLYLVAKSTSKASTNLYVTRNFNSFEQVTFNSPERKVNWMFTELVKWRSDDGRLLKGVLYKPENFDSTKKYPIIFYFYRKASDNLNAFIVPRECPGCIIDIPAYVSSGYLVFVPDLFFTKGEPGKNALNAVVSAANYLKGKPFINSRKMGIQGCSFSGFTTNYIVTHTDLFTAACSASGLFDLVSGYNSLNNGSVKQPEFEFGAYQIGGNLWTDKSAYVENSAIFNADKLVTPFLIMHTTDDYTIPFNNALEFFLAAKRLNKKVWLLQYDDQFHTVFGLEGLDFNIRMRQFFDYYLKDSLPPKWMTIGKLVTSDGKDVSIDLDSTGINP